MIRAINTSGESRKKRKLRPKANRGVHTKFIRRLRPVTFTFLNAAFKLAKGICRKIPKSITMRKGRMKCAAASDMASIWPKARPKNIAISIKSHWYFS